LKRILEIQDSSGVDSTRANLHEFEKVRSTLTSSLELELLIARAQDKDRIVFVASLDLSSTFNVMNHVLLPKG
jgi:hypothetical protein